MKYLYLLLTACLFAVVSCNRFDVVTSCDSEKSESVLLNELAELNKSIVAETDESTKATAKQVASVAIADISGAGAGAQGGAKIGATVGACLGSPITGGVFGAAVGALVVGAACSWAASPDTKSFSHENLDFDSMSQICEQVLNMDDREIEASTLQAGKLINIDEAVLESVDLDDSSLRIGMLHNYVLAALNGDIDIQVDAKTKSASHSGMVDAILNSSEMQALYNEITTRVSSGDYDIDNTLPTSVINLFIQIYETCSGSCEDVSVLINKYQSVIQNSDELSDTDKTYISDAFSTALYSFNFWSNAK